MAKASKEIIKQDPKNFNKHSEFGMGLLEKSIRKFGFVEAGVLSEDNVIVGGNARNEVAESIGIEDKQIIDIDGTKQVYLRRKGLISGTDEFKELALALNAVPKANIVFDAEVLEAEVSDAMCEEWGVNFNKETEIDGADEKHLIPVATANLKLSERFIIPPFSVFDTKQGYWQERKRYWLSIGIKSELGRGGGMTYNDHDWQAKKLNKIQAPH